MAKDLNFRWIIVMIISENLKAWIHNCCKFNLHNIIPLRYDAGFRRYFRVVGDKQTYVAIDASLEKSSCLPFANISSRLLMVGLNAPNILFSDYKLGFMLVTDFGDDLLLHKLNLATVDSLYDQAIQNILILQDCNLDNMQKFSIAIMRNETDLFTDWFLLNYLGLCLSAKKLQKLHKIYNFIAETAISQPQVFMHRDYHSKNLMVLADKRIGILDFQDACVGPVMYDLVSLLRDCYISWPNEKVDFWLSNWYLKSRYKNKYSLDQFRYWFDFMSVQRHLQALMVFARKFIRDQDDRFLQYIPRTLNYVFNITSKYSILKSLNEILFRS